MNKKSAVILFCVALILTGVMGVAAWHAKAEADRYRARVEVLEKAIEKTKEEIKANDKVWRGKLDEAEERYRKAEKARSEATAIFREWMAGDHPEPGSSDEIIRRLEALGFRAGVRR